jgi:molybdopterin-guanine dinucleotide biosynthesis protein B
MTQPLRKPARPPVICVTGPSGSGKTTLVVTLVQELRALGVRVAALKHASHGFQMDRPGKDTWKMRRAGASEVAVVGGGEVALIADAAARGAAGRDPDPVLLARSLFRSADLVLAEGFAACGAPRVEVLAGERKPAVEGSGRVLAFVSRGDAAREGGEAGAPVFAPFEADRLARFLLEVCGIAHPDRGPGERVRALEADAAARPPRPA